MTDSGTVWSTGAIDELLGLVLPHIFGAEGAQALATRFRTAQASLLTSWATEETRRAARTKPSVSVSPFEPTARLSHAQLAFAAHAAAYCDLLCDIGARNVRLAAI